MGMSYQGQEKLSIAKSVVKSMNLSLPELDFTSGMMTFGHCSGVSKKDALLVYGMTKYSTADLGSAVDEVTCAGGTTPLGTAIKEAHENLKKVDGKTALIIVSDGKDLLHNPKTAMDELAAEVGDLCTYTIQIGDDAAGAKNLEQLAAATACGMATTADHLASANNMADFVQNVFVTPAPKPMPVAKPAEKPILDSDGDGVPDHLDKCPGTPKGAVVDSEGCWIIGRIYFDFDKAVIKPEAEPVLNEIADVMMKNPELNMNINGFTDNIGSMDYNQKLSEKRAQAAKDFLVNQGIDSSRFTINGFSYTMPISPNDTPEGRAMNRRVEFAPFE
jgi:OOP family OmpA-OmpF porin